MYTEIKITNEIKEETKINKHLSSYAKECTEFWNREGAKIYCENLLGNLGNKETNIKARNTKYDSWLLDCILIDIETLIKCNYLKELKVGRTSSHVYVHTLVGNEERILMLYVTNKKK